MSSKSKMKTKIFKPCVLAFHEKHSISYYWAFTEDQFFEVCLGVLTERFKQDWYYSPKIKEPEVALEQIEAFPDGSVKNAALRAYKVWKRNNREDEFLRDEYDTIKMIVSSGKGPEAWEMLMNREDAEYERVEKIYPEGDYPLPRLQQDMKV